MLGTPAPPGHFSDAREAVVAGVSLLGLWRGIGWMEQVPVFCDEQEHQSGRPGAEAGGSSPASSGGHPGAAP